jgi:uncharacterized membrane protein YcaP (DUF421 family)
MNTYFDIILRSLVIYVFIVLAIRIFGKKTFTIKHYRLGADSFN